MKTNSYFILWILLLMFSLNGNSQFKEDLECGTEVDPDSYLHDFSYANNKKLIEIILQENIPIPEGYFEYLGMKKPEGLNRFDVAEKIYIPIKLWVYREDNGAGNMGVAQAYTLIEELNQIYANNTNFAFYLLCDISFINNSTYANNSQYFETYTLQNKMPNVLNVHVVLDFYPKNWLGIANPPWSTSGVGQMLNPRAFSCAIKHELSASNTLAHEIGHTLGLLHTHHAGRSNKENNGQCGDCYQESVSRSKTQGLLCVSTVGKKKCEVNGDFLCDTAADPGLTLGDVGVYSCKYIGVGTDNWGKPWDPNANNIMSYSANNCRNYFTPMQVAKMIFYKDLMDVQYPTFNITGPNYLCIGEPTNFTVNSLSGVTDYHWEVPNNVTILSGQGTNSVTVEAIQDPVYGEIVVTPSCNSKPAKHTISPPNYTPITGPEEVCVLHVGTSYSTTYIPGVTYNWTITNGAIVSGQGTNQVEISLTSHPSNMSLIKVNTGLCNSSGGGAQYIMHIPPGLDCRGEIIPETNSEESNGYEESNIILYPNPAENSVVVLMPEDEIYDLSVMDVYGQIKHIQKNIKNTEYTVNVNSFNPGVYFVCLTSSITGETIIKRLIINK